MNENLEIAINCMDKNTMAKFDIEQMKALKIRNLRKHLRLIAEGQTTRYKARLWHAVDKTDREEILKEISNLHNDEQ